MRIGLLPLIAIFCACATLTKPPDPYANVDVSRPLYKKLTLALIQTQKMRDNARAATSMMCYGGIYAPRAWFDESMKKLEMAFRKVISVDSPEAGRAAQADLIAIMDDRTVLSCARATVDISLRATFLTLDEKQIDSVAGENWGYSSKTNSFWNPMSKGSGRLWTPRNMASAVDEALYNFEGALFSSEKLKEFARTGQAVAANAFRLSDVDELPEAAAPRKGHAIVIGIENYRAKLPSASFAAADARLVAKYLNRAAGYPEAEIALLTDGQAGKSDFEKYFESWLPSRVGPGDEVFVYFSGHGAPNPSTGDSYLVPYDGDPMYLAKTAFPLQRMYEALSKLPASKITVALDSCFSGAGGRSVIAAGARPLVTVKQTNIPANITVLAAAKSDEVSNTYKDKGHGLFTYYFLRGLKEHPGDWRAAFDYLKPEVSKAARRDFNANQEPQWLGGQ